MNAALIVVPTHDHPLLLPFALRSACAQSVDDLQIVVIGDGVGDDTRDCLSPLMHDDQRIQFLDLPKSGRTGEPHRDQVVTSTDAEIVTYLGDDDLLAPDHVATMRALLDNTDLAHPPRVLVTLDGAVQCDAIDLGDPAWRELELAGTSLVGLTGLAHTSRAYRRLPYGWRETPEDRYTDQHMIQQFLAQPWCRAVAGEHATTLHFPGSLRNSMSSAQRLDELQTWAELLAAPGAWAQLRSDADDSFRRGAHSDRRTAIHLGRRLHETDLRIVDLERTVLRLEQELRHGADLHATANEERDAARLDVVATREELTASRAALDEIRGRLVRSEDAREVALGAGAERAATVAALQDALGAKSAELDTLLATRTIRLRSILIRSRLVRTLFARRRAARGAIPR